MYRRNFDPSDSFDSHAEQRRQTEESEDGVRAFETMTFDQQEEFLQNARDVFAAAQYASAVAHRATLSGFDLFESCAPVAPVSVRRLAKKAA